MATEKDLLTRPEGVQELIDQKNYSAAVVLLREQVAVEPTDEKRRSLARCYSELNQYQEAINILNGIENKDYLDVARIGCAYLQSEDWERAKEFLDASIKIKEDPRVYFFLAEAYAEGKKNYELAEVAKSKLIDNLQRAIELPHCWPSAFLRLAELKYANRESAGEKINLLEKGLLSNSESDVLRVELAKLYLDSVNDPSKAIDVLLPLLQVNTPVQEALWYAYRASEKKEDWEAALSYLNRINPVDNTWGIGIEKVKGDLLLASGRPIDAINSYTKEIERKGVEAKFIGLFSRAWVRIKIGDLSLSLQDVTEAAKLWFEKAETGFDGPLGIEIDGRTFWHHDNGVVDEVCKYVLSQVNTGKLEISNNLKGMLSYLIYSIHKYEEESLTEMLLQAETLIMHPKIFNDLSEHYLNTGKISLAVRYLLKHCLWEYSRRDQSGPFPSSYTELGLDENEKISKRERSKIRKEALEFLKSQSDPEAIESIVLPFYQSFWRGLLLEDKCFDEMSDISKFFVEHVPDSTDSLFDYAYSMHELNRLDESEKAYRKLLEYEPNNSSALHNLSILLEKQDRLEEAVQLSNSAISIAPDKDLILRQNNRLKQVVEQKVREKQKQDDFLRTAADRWSTLDRFKKQLLSALVSISGFDSWGHLSKLSGIGEEYLRGHWNKLIEQGMLIRNKNGIRGESGERYVINEHILHLIKREQSHSVVTKIIRSEASIAFKPIFNSKSEYTIYNFLIGLFPNHLVFPNMALQSIFQYERMKELLDSKEFQYYLMSHVDFCITSTANYLPIIAFELDSDYHDLKSQKERDVRKDRIFQIGGVSLLRLRIFGNPTEQAIRQDLIKAVRELGESIRSTSNQAGVHVNLTLEIDFEKFGQ